MIGNYICQAIEVQKVSQNEPMSLGQVMFQRDNSELWKYSRVRYILKVRNQMNPSKVIYDLMNLYVSWVRLTNKGIMVYD